MQCWKCTRQSAHGHGVRRNTPKRAKRMLSHREFQLLPMRVPACRTPLPCRIEVPFSGRIFPLVLVGIQGAKTVGSLISASRSSLLVHLPLIGTDSSIALSIPSWSNAWNNRSWNWTNSVEPPSMLHIAKVTARAHKHRRNCHGQASHPLSGHLLSSLRTGSWQRKTTKDAGTRCDLKIWYPVRLNG